MNTYERLKNSATSKLLFYFFTFQDIKILGAFDVEQFYVCDFFTTHPLNRRFFSYPSFVWVVC